MSLETMMRNHGFFIHANKTTAYQKDHVTDVF
jgi:hypothetical protein